ncbi:DUF456 family protein [Verrucomicrobiales bacterium]|nr:DUF456 family protein [Verrucomicrobiales bacterium]
MQDYLNIYLLWALISLFFLVISLVSNIMGFPGNWMMLAIAGVYSWLMPSESPYGFGISIIIVILICAIIGEILEFFTGVISTKKAGGSRRAICFSVVGSVGGSLVGIFVGIPIPIIGSLIGALIFSGLGALLGAYYGEKVEGKNSAEAWKIGVSSFTGRILGSVCKIFCGVLILILISCSMLYY